MIDLDACNAAAVRTRAAMPVLTKSLSEIGEAESTKWLRMLHRLVSEELAFMGAAHDIERAWCDVQLASGRWVGRWVDDCLAEAVIECAFWHGEPAIAAGVGLKGTTHEQDARQARIDSGDLLALLGDEW